MISSDWQSQIFEKKKKKKKKKKFVSLEQCLITSGGKTHIKIGGPNLDQIAQNWAQN